LGERRVNTNAREETAAFDNAEFEAEVDRRVQLELVHLKGLDLQQGKRRKTQGPKYT
jgi:hypothetical protein